MTLQEYVDSLRNKRIAVIGIGVSNTPLIELLAGSGCRVTACDKRTADQMCEEAEHLQSMGVALKLGEDYLDGLDQDIIFRTPGLMPFDEHLQAAVRQGSELTSEMEVFFKLCPCRIIAVGGVFQAVPLQDHRCNRQRRKNHHNHHHFRAAEGGGLSRSSRWQYRTSAPLRSTRDSAGRRCGA